MSTKKWWEIYANDEEKKFFVGKDGHSGLIRKTGFNWRTIERLAVESGLTKANVEQIINKYQKIGVVVQHGKDAEKWGYWENVAKEMAPVNPGAVKDDQQKRVDKAKKKI